MQIIDKAKIWIQNNKKMAILLAVVFVIVIAMLVSKSNNNKVAGFTDITESLNSEEAYVADGTLKINNKTLLVNVNKNADDYALSLSSEDKSINYQNLIVSAENTIYINNESVETNSGLISIPKSEEKKVVGLYDVIFDTISSSQYVTFESDNEKQIITVNTTENWKGFWSELYTNIESNIDQIASGFAGGDVVKTQIRAIMATIKKFADTETIANTLTIDCVHNDANEVNNYEYNFDITLDLTILPSFISQEDFDTNKAKMTGTIIFTPSNAMTINKPTGSIHANALSATEAFMSSLWNSIFDRIDYVPFNQVSTTNDSVTNTHFLGDTTEICQILFNKDGVDSASWCIKSTDQNVINSYIQKYKNGENKDNFITFDDGNGLHTLTIKVSQSGIDSMNRVAKTVKGYAEYLKTSKGGEIIV